MSRRHAADDTPLVSPADIRDCSREARDWERVAGASVASEDLKWCTFPDDLKCAKGRPRALAWPGGMEHLHSPECSLTLGASSSTDREWKKVDADEWRVCLVFTERLERVVVVVAPFGWRTVKIVLGESVVEPSGEENEARGEARGEARDAVVVALEDGEGGGGGRFSCRRCSLCCRGFRCCRDLRCCCCLAFPASDLGELGFSVVRDRLRAALGEAPKGSG